MKLVNHVKCILIHAPHAGSDEKRGIGSGRQYEFQSTLPHAGSDCPHAISQQIMSVFQSTLPIRGATCREKSRP